MLQSQNLRDYLFVLWMYRLARVYEKEEERPAVYFELKEAKRYSRYLYLLVKYFLKCGYRVYVNMGLGDRYSFQKDSSAQFLFREKHLTFGRPPKISSCLVFNDQNLSLDYFRKDSLVKTFHVPIGQHPEMYFRGYWNEELAENLPRKKSLIFIGSFEEKNYSQRENEEHFNVISRFPLYTHLRQHPAFLELHGEQELEAFLASDQDHKLILLNATTGSPICQSMIRGYLSRFEFFIAFPGVVMPLCHNLVEAISSGCIPILQTGYAQALRPPLEQDSTCLTFENLEDIDEKINALLSLPTEKLETLRANLALLYQTHFTPSAIVSKLIEGDYDRVCVLGEYHSVHFGWWMESTRYQVPGTK